MNPGNDERSASGAPIYRHEERTKPFSIPNHATSNLEQIEAHVEAHIGKVETVYHEIISDLVHIDVLFVKATDERPYHVLVTSGVSDEPMNVPPGLEEHRRVELLIALPKDWPLTSEAMEEENNYWPIRWLKTIGRLPHEYDTWIGWGHTIPNGDPAENIANTNFVGFMLAPPYVLPVDFFELKTSSDAVIKFYALIPLFQEEMDFKLKNGSDAIEELLNEHDGGFEIDPTRPNVAKSR
ncbi:MAG: suppressor of fused domain protein [Fibrobacterota bacterium]|nr:suppressor of fused domain protein [Fibrobacterota bacterium]QQS03233.1 MAG: suppressor of fused domain protein [Fibrobacterota bacterium]